MQKKTKLLHIYLTLLIFLGIPLIFVTYSASWDFAGVLTSACKNISLQLDSLQELLEETLTKRCQLLNVNTTAQFTYSFLDIMIYLFISTYTLNHIYFTK